MSTSKARSASRVVERHATAAEVAFWAVIVAILVLYLLFIA